MSQFFLGFAGFLCLPLLAAALWRWQENGGTVARPLIMWAVIGTIGFASALMMAGYSLPGDCSRLATRTDAFCY